MSDSPTTIGANTASCTPTVAPGAHLGDFIWYSFRDVAVQKTAFSELLTACGLDPAAAPAEPSPETAFKRAVQHTATLTLAKGFLLREIHNTGKELVFAVVRETKLQTKADLEYATEDKVTFDKVNRAKRVSHGGHPVAQAVEAAFATFDRALTDAEVRGWLQKRLAELAAVPLRENGGVYFIPAIYADNVRRLAQVIGSKATGRSQMSVVPTFDGAEARGSIGGAARETLADELRALEEEIAAFDTKTRGATMRRRLETFDALRDRADLYARIVGCVVDDIKTGLKAQEDRIMALLAVAPGDA